jgi:amidohydrolase
MGHACGHNLIAIVSIAAGLATADIMKRYDLSGKVMIFGTPGEEGIGGGKIQLLKAGAYDGVDISLISHPGIFNNSPRVRTTAFARLEVEYFGRASHAANSPWLGINALDALIIAYNAVSALRQQTMPTDVIGMNITNGGDRPNTIHAYASGSCVIRANTSSRLTELQEKVSACFRAGAEATGARLDLQATQTTSRTTCSPHRTRSTGTHYLTSRTRLFLLASSTRSSKRVLIRGISAMRCRV